MPTTNHEARLLEVRTDVADAAHGCRGALRSEAVNSLRRVDAALAALDRGALGRGELLEVLAEALAVADDARSVAKGSK